MKETEAVIIDGVTYLNRTTINAVESARAIRAKMRVIKDAAKDVPCADCGIRYPYYVMDFDHVRGEKYKAISKISCISRLVVEMPKCEVVCANCHRERTFNSDD